jgi:hypothetical protein
MALLVRVTGTDPRTSAGFLKRSPSAPLSARRSGSVISQSPRDHREAARPIQPRLDQFAAGGASEDEECARQFPGGERILFTVEGRPDRARQRDGAHDTRQPGSNRSHRWML